MPCTGKGCGTTVVIFYCEKCGQRVPDADLQSGSAGQLDEVRAICIRCGGRKATGSIVRRSSSKAATSPPPPAPMIEGLAPSVAHPDSHSHAASPQDPPAPPSKLALWGGLTVGALFLVLIIVFAATRGSDSRTTAEATARKTAVQRDIPLPPPLPVNPPPTLPPVTPQPDRAPTSGDTTTGGDYDPRAYVAASKLNEAKVYFNKNPKDPWGFNDQLENVKTSYRGTPSAAEAETLQKTLDLTGERPAQRMNWHLEWKSETDNRNDNHWTMDRSWDGRSFVLHTHPPERGKPAAFGRTVKVPEDRPFLMIRTRGNDRGDFRGRVEVDGKEVLSEIVAGRTWRTFHIDLTEFKGREVPIRIVHQNTEWDSEHGHWLPPEFLAQKPAGAALPPLPTATDWSKASAMIPLIDPAMDTLDGQWSIREGALILTPSQGMDRLAVPYEPPEEYDVRAIVTRTRNTGGLAFALPRGQAAVAFVLAGKDNSLCGFERIDGLSLEANPERIHRDNTIQNGRPYTVVIQVRKDAIRCYLDGEPLMQTIAGNARLSLTNERKMPKTSQMGLTCWESGYEIREFQVLPVTGTGRALRAESVPVASAQRTDVQTTGAPVKAATYPVFLDELLRTVAVQNWTEAKEKLANAARAPELADRAAALKSDTELVAWAEKVPLAVAKGAALLTDGREFSIQTGDGKRYDLGTGRKAQIVKSSETGLQVKQNVGGGSLVFDLSFNSLTEATRMDLAQVGLGPEADSRLAIAAYRLGLSSKTNRTAERKEIGDLLTATTRQGAQVERVAQVRRWLDFLVREDAARTALETLNAALTQHVHDSAFQAYNAFRKDFADTAVFASAIPRFPEMEKRLYELSTQHGLWGGCWKAEKDSRWIELLFQDTVASIGWGDKTGPREKRFPTDWFSLRYGGLLRITKAGTYIFHLAADDRVRIWVDGKVIGNGKTVELSEGDHAFKLEYEEDNANDFMKIEWTPPDETTKVKVPDNVFWHIPSQRENYLK